MPPLPRWYIRTAFVWLLMACLVAAALALGQASLIDGRVAVLLPVFYHLLMVGWATQLIFGVAIWLFPVASRERPRGNERLAWLGYGALNGGLLLRGLAEPLLAWVPAPPVRWSVVVAAVLQVAALWLSVLALWPRIKAKKPVALRSGAGRSDDAAI